MRCVCRRWINPTLTPPTITSIQSPFPTHIHRTHTHKIYCLHCRIGGSIPIVFAYFGEFCPLEGRGRKLGFLLMFWVLGGIYVSGLAWIIIPETGGALWRDGTEQRERASVGSEN